MAQELTQAICPVEQIACITSKVVLPGYGSFLREHEKSGVT
jgi:hypothetical protein